MSYEVTATRRRPQAFEALAGQEFVAETLKNSIQSQKIAHAYLFSGPRGCGKTSTARILAKALNCADGPAATPCGKCQQCVEITKGASTDVIEIDGASNTSVNDVRQIKDEVLFPPQSSRYKIYIIDEVHMLSTSAFNALLKTIEEPPPYCIFIFATTELQKVPATIKSRCQQFNFRLVPAERVKQLLAEAAAEIGINADDEALYWIARESTGSVRDAYTLFDQVAAFSGDHITYDKIRDKLGLVGVDRLNAVFEDAAAGRAQDALLKIDEFLQNGVSIEQLIINSTDYLRSLLLIRAGITKDALLGQSRERYSQAVLEAWSPVQIERAMSILLQLYRDIRYSLSPRYELELAFSRLSWLTQYVSPSEVKKAIDEAKSLLLGRSGAQQAQSSQSAPRQFISVPEGEPQQSTANPYVGRVITQADMSGQAQGGSAPARNFFAPPPAPVSQQPEMSEDLAPPDPTPHDADWGQSFSYGGAVPPQQTAVSASSDFKSAALKELSMRDPMLASSLYQTGEWVRNGGRVTTKVSSGYLKMQLGSHTRHVSEFLSGLLGEQVQFEVLMNEPEATGEAQEDPVQVRLLCDIFKGHVIGHSKRSEQDMQAETKPNQSPAQEKADDDADDEAAADTGDDGAEDND